MKLRCLLIVAATLILASACIAQIPATVQCPPNAPISVQVSPIAAGDARAVANVTNTGKQEISAILLSWKITNSAGVSVTEVTTIDFSPADTALGPGQSQQMENDLPSRPTSPIQSIEVGCQNVLFVNGGVWGNAKAPELVRLKALRTGMRAERRRLLSIYQTKGLDQLLAELKKPIPH